MATRRPSRFLLALGMTASIQAQVLLNYPPNVGFDVDTASKAPCGISDSKLKISDFNTTEFHIDGDSIAIEIPYPQGTTLFRGTLDTTASGGWEQLFPIVEQTGLGSFCQPVITVPSHWLGHEGFVSIVGDSSEGLSYQCAAVKFVSKAGPDHSECKNATGVSAAFTKDAKLATLVSSATATSSGSSETTATTTDHSDSGKITESSSTSTNSSPEPSATGGPSSGGSSSGGSSLSTGAIAGIAVGSALGGALLCVGLFLLYRSRKRASRPKPAPDPSNTSGKAELGNGRGDEHKTPVEVLGSTEIRSEMLGSTQIPSEMQGSTQVSPELHDDSQTHVRHELPTS